VRYSISAVSSASQSPMLNWCEVTRVPGFMARMVGRRRMFSSGSRYMVTTVALLKSSLKMSPWMIFTRSAAPSACTKHCASFAMSGLYSMPTAVAPNFLPAAMAILPSPAPRSKT